MLSKFIKVFQRVGFDGCQFSVLINIQIWKNLILFQQKRLADIVGVSTTGGEFSVIQLHTIFITRFLFWDSSFVSLFNVVSWGQKSPWNSVVYFKNDGSKNELFNECSIILELFSWRVCSCKVLFSESRWINNQKKITGKQIMILWYRFLIGSSLSVISVWIKVADSCNNILVFFLIGFLNWRWKCLRASREKESSRSILMFSILSVIRKENWLFPKSTRIKWQSSFCEGSIIPCLTKLCTGLIWSSYVNVANEFAMQIVGVLID